MGEVVKHLDLVTVWEGATLYFFWFSTARVYCCHGNYTMMTSYLQHRIYKLITVVVSMATINLLWKDFCHVAIYVQASTCIDVYGGSSVVAVAVTTSLFIIAFFQL